MLRLAARRAASKALTQSLKPLRLSTPAARFGTNGRDASQQELVARQMIQYALSLARSQKSEESYAQAQLVLQQGLSNLGGGEEDAKGMLMLAMSTLHYERGQFQDAVEKLETIRSMVRASLSLRVAALEGLAGLNLEAGQDVTSSVLADDSFQLLEDSPGGFVPKSGVLKTRAKAIKGLANLANGDLGSARLYFEGFQDYNVEEEKNQLASVALSHGEYLHCCGNFSLAKDLYERVVGMKDVSGDSYLAAANMVTEEVLLGATCALGQLLSHSGKFDEAEEFLTKALTRAEDHFGSTHPKVGVVLTCMAIMFKHRAKMEASSSILIQEGLYRRAINLLKAPGLDSEVADMQVDRRQIVALARGGYAELLCIQQNRKGEGEEMKKWAEATWRNRRLSLAQALEFSEHSNAAVIDTRICRVL